MNVLVLCARKMVHSAKGQSPFPIKRNLLFKGISLTFESIWPLIRNSSLVTHKVEVSQKLNLFYWNAAAIIKSDNAIHGMATFLPR